MPGRRRPLALLTALALAGGAAFAAGPPATAAEDYPEWNNNPDVFAVGSEPPHATLMPYDTLDRALAADRADSPYRLSLDGDWKFQWFKNPAARDQGFYAADVDDSGWDTIKVPSS
ncbi:hypothetical protein, partial [Motilibacter deserti]